MRSVTLYEDGAGHLALWASGPRVKARGFVGLEEAESRFADDAAAILNGDADDWTVAPLDAEPEESTTTDGWRRVAMYWRNGDADGVEILAHLGSAAEDYLGVRVRVNAAATLGARGGKVRSPAKAAASRANGAKRQRELLPCHRCETLTRERDASRRPNCGCAR